MKCEQIGDATLYLGDARDIGLIGEALITDPVWPNVNKELQGRDDPFGLLASVLEPVEVDRLVIHLGCLSDPRFLAAVPARFPFFRTCWLEYARPHYVGRNIQGSDLAYVFGSPIAFEKGRQTVPGRSPKAQPGTTSREHPCARSTTFTDWLVFWFSDDGDTVVDPFMGSGTTGVSCVNIGRKFIGVEIEERFFDVACRRIEAQERQGRLFYGRRKAVPELRLL